MGARINVGKPKPSPKCPNGHQANRDGNCSDPQCPYRISKRHDAIGGK